MKLLFDENLSPKLPKMLALDFPDSVHVRECGLLGRTDDEVWDHARANGYTLVSKDADFQQRGLLHGAPPKLVWLRIGNCTTQSLVQLITSHASDLHALDVSPTEAVLVLS
jgi:predicted nuclease of predicted toxin-antitoxin system